MSCLIYIENESGDDDGFIHTNGIGESVRDYIMLRAARLHPEVHRVLSESDFAQEWWPGCNLELNTLIKAAEDRSVAVELATVDDACVDEIADNPTWRANLIRALELTAQLLNGELKGVHYPELIRKGQMV